MLVSLVRKALKRERTIAELHALAEKHYRSGEFERAEQYLSEIALREEANAKAWSNLSAALLKQQKYRAAVPVLSHLLELEPDLAEAHFDLANCYNRIQKNTLAIRHYRRAIELKPDLDKAHAQLVNALMDACEWYAVEQWCAGFREFIATHPPDEWHRRLEPFCAIQLFPGDIHKAIAVGRAREIARGAADGALRPAPRRHASSNRIRIGYVCADFYDHATAHLTYSLYAAHDRSAFEVIAYSTGPTDGSVYRRHIEKTCDRFHDVRHESARRTAERIHADGIDILVDMKGHTAENRLAIFARRPAPVQVSYLAYPGTSGAEFIDYFISDSLATPPGFESEFTEAIVRLPDSYQVNDQHQPISAEAITRASHGLPENAFVFCSFNRLRKIDPKIFSSWTAVLARVPNSVLWLLAEDRLAEANLRKEAAARRIAPQRLLFSPKAAKPLHLARHRLADLFLDTYTYNAHTGASDALWAGLPVLTCPGKTFATRVAASLLTAAGLSELIAKDLQAYEETAVRLAHDRTMVTALQEKLAKQRLSCALFDTPRYVRNLESAYRHMHDAAMRGAAPRSFSV